MWILPLSYRNTFDFSDRKIFILNRFRFIKHNTVLTKNFWKYFLNNANCIIKRLSNYIKIESFLKQIALIIKNMNIIHAKFLDCTETSGNTIF